MTALAIAARLLADLFQDAAFVVPLQQQLLPLRAVVLGGRQGLLQTVTGGDPLLFVPLQVLAYLIDLGAQAFIAGPQLIETFLLGTELRLQLGALIGDIAHLTL